MEMRNDNFTTEIGQVVGFEKMGNFIDNIEEVYNFLHYDCYSVPDISINEEPKQATNLAWIRRNVDIKLKNIENIKYIDNRNILEIKYLNGDIIKLFKD